MDFTQKHDAYLAACESTLEQVVEHFFQDGSVVSDAAAYSLLGGGKRVRGVMTLAVAEMLDGKREAAECFAAAIEMVHAFSLIHDDLPCLDDDDLRRGRPACHIKFGEANALLAGDLLAIQAFSAIQAAPCSAESRIEASGLLAYGAGARGMIYGQELDIAAESRPVDLDELKKIHAHKTGCLFRVAALLGVMAAEQKKEDHPAICEFIDDIGLVFQIVDDILDVTANEEDLGKPIGSDAEQGKSTFITLVGLKEARRQAEQLTTEATQGLRGAYGERAAFLCEYADRLLQRVK